MIIREVTTIGVGQVVISKVVLVIVVVIVAMVISSDGSSINSRN